jgi:hypothetical protein
MNQCKCVASGFLANGGILERCRVKVNLKDIFYLFQAWRVKLKRQKDQVNHWKTLARRFNEK